MLCTCRQQGHREREAPLRPPASNCDLAADAGRALGLHHSCPICWQPHSEIISELAATL